MAAKKTTSKPKKAPAASAPPTYATRAPALATSRFWKDPDDPNAVRVWADALSEEGDVRGEFIQLSALDAPSPEQEKRRATLFESLGGKLIGPARPFLRSWRFGRFGLVTFIVTEAKLFVPGFELIAQLHPRLTATVTALRAKPLIADVAKLPLHRIHYLLLEWTGLTDAALTMLAPALKGVRNLSLAFNDVTAAGLAALAPYASSLESLALGTSLKQREHGDTIGAGWVETLTGNAAFAGLRSVTLYNYHSQPSEAQLDRLRAMPNMKHVGVGQPLYDLGTLEAAKAGLT